MQYPKYQTLTVSSDYAVYTFISSGPNGDFEIEVQFTLIEGTSYYNLGFGALGDNREIDDTIVLNNSDKDKILATVAGFVDNFLTTYPHRQIFFTGSSHARTRLYRRAITMNLASLIEQFIILGITAEANVDFEVFQPSKNYVAFLVLKKDYI